MGIRERHGFFFLGFQGRERMKEARILPWREEEHDAEIEKGKGEIGFDGVRGFCIYRDRERSWTIQPPPIHVFIGIFFSCM